MANHAENQSGLGLSYKKFYAVRKLVCANFGERFHYDMMMSTAAETLKYGDTQPALVVSTNPLRIAAYSDELDAVVMLRFPEELARQYDLSVGTRLTTANVYLYEYGPYGKDYFPGAGFTHQFADFVPVVQLFLGKNDEKIRSKVNLFDAATWEKVAGLAEEYQAEHPGMERDGFFYAKKAKKK